MDKLFHRSLFIFRRDLRLEDNTALIAALRQSTVVIPCFIFDPRQFKVHPFLSHPGLRFMVESLVDLQNQLKERGGRLYIFEGEAEKIVGKLLEDQNIDAIFVNQDYTPFAQKRDKAIAHVAQKASIQFCSFHDCTLNPPDAVKKDDGGIYTVYTPYARRAMQRSVGLPQKNSNTNYETASIGLEGSAFWKKVKDTKPHTLYPGGRQAAVAILKRMRDFKNYAVERNLPDLQATTRLSPHHKFGTCSIREVYHAIYKNFGPGHALINEIYWRDFFTQIGYNYPRVLGEAFKESYKKLTWENDERKFKAWCEGQTGFPIVDAGMRELNETGFMHNRVRMITASFLVKDLHIDWQWGERYFATKLVDYDPLVNNGNWQWAASTGCDAQPYFRIFNPWLQQEKFDPQALYIKRWVGELKDTEAKSIHQIAKKQTRFPGYPLPIISHDQERVRALARYQSV